MNRNDLIVRIITSAILISAIAAIVFILPNWFFCLVATIFIARGLYEFFSLVEKKGIHIYKYIGMLIGVFIPISIYVGFESTRGWELLFMVALFLFLFILQFTRRENHQAVVGISTTFFGILYVSWFFSFLVKLRFIQDANLPDGRLLAAFLILVTKVGDIGAYIVGSSLGRHSLIPRISPKKTVEGTLGGLIFSLLAAVACKPFMYNFSYPHLVSLGLLLGGLGQVGDLSESLIKRDCDVKDAGIIFPGLGGVLDIIDSILFTAPVFYLYIGRFIL